MGSSDRQADNSFISGEDENFTVNVNHASWTGSSRDYRSLWSVDCNASAFRKTTGIKCEEMITKRKEAQQEENDQII